MFIQNLQNILNRVIMDQSKMIFLIEQVTSTPTTRPRRTAPRVITPNISGISWTDDSPLDHNQSDVISLDCTSLLEDTQDIIDAEDSYESFASETTIDCSVEWSLASQVLNKGFVEHIQQQVNDKLRCEEHKECRRKEQLIFKLSKCFADCLQENHGDLHKTNTIKKVFTKISRCLLRKQTTKVKTVSRSKTIHVFYPSVSAPTPPVVDISKELGLLSGNTFLKEGRKCTWC